MCIVINRQWASKKKKFEKTEQYITVAIYDMPYAKGKIGLTVCETILFAEV